MPTTPGGTTYVQHTTTLPAGDLASLITPPTVRALIVYTHGNAGAWNQFATLAAWATFRNWCMDHQIAVVESAGAGDNWAGPASRLSYEQTVSFARSLLGVLPVVVLGRSMGALVAYWLAASSAFAAEVVGLIVNSGTTDLALRYSAATGSDLSNLNAAYGLPGSVKNVPAFAAASAGHDPMLFTDATYAGLPVLQQWGTADTTVVPSEHGLAWWNRFSDVVPTPPSGTSVRAGGDHSASNGSFLDVAPMTAFVSNVIGPEPDPPIISLRGIGMFLLDSAGRRYPIVGG